VLSEAGLTQMAKLDENVLLRKWMHSREEDTDTELVFRPADYDFPRSRGRTGIELQRGGKLVEIGIAPADGQEESEGKWSLEGDDKLVFYSGSESTPSRVLEVVSAEKDRLVVKK
jgi:hypothetical protein